MELSAWDIIRSTVQWLILPLVAGLTYFVKKHMHNVDRLDQQVREIEVRTAVVESKINDIRDDLKEIKRGVEKLVDRK